MAEAFSLILASSNAHKAQEFATLFTGKLNVVPATFSLEVDETGTTFQENAFIKAKAYYDKFQSATLADDSGLVVEALPDLLAVQSARFAPELASYKDKCARLLELMEPHHGEARKAYFVCVLCCYFNPQEVYFFEGRVHGVIATEYRGAHGFGYDPVFVPERKENDGLTLAELPEWKDINSHRARAAQSALLYLAGRQNH